MRIVVLSILLTIFFSCNQEPQVKEQQPKEAKPLEKEIALKLIVEGLHAPVAVANAGDDRMFVVEQPGKIVVIKNGKLSDKPFLDISNKVDKGKGYSEKGLLGMAFHPSYKSNGRFFIYYSAPFKKSGFDHKSILAEYKVDPNDPDRGLPSEKILLEVPQPESNHNGGCIEFGPDGYLYIGLGDGGGAGDRHGKIGNALDLNTLLGKILRIDVNSTGAYKIPADNPFVNRADAKPEIFAYGLRNPWKFSFDKSTGEMYCGDVGQDKYEEINIIRKSANYGWRAMEGNHPFDSILSYKDLVKPIYEYPHAIGISVIGGYVYRGKEFTELKGRYFFGDWSGKLFYLENGSSKEVPILSKEKLQINSFGENKEGEIFVLGQFGVGVDSEKGALFQLILR